MAESDKTRNPARIKPNPRVLWSLPGGDDLQVGMLREASPTGARIITRPAAKVDDEIRFDVVGSDGQTAASGLARVLSVDERGLTVSFIALGVDPGLVALLMPRGDEAPQSLPPPASEAPAEKRLDIVPRLPSSPSLTGLGALIEDALVGLDRALADSYPPPPGPQRSLSSPPSAREGSSPDLPPPAEARAPEPEPPAAKPPAAAPASRPEGPSTRPEGLAPSSRKLPPPLPSVPPPASSRTPPPLPSTPPPSARTPPPLPTAPLSSTARTQPSLPAVQPPSARVPSSPGLAPPSSRAPSSSGIAPPSSRVQPTFSPPSSRNPSSPNFSPPTPRIDDRPAAPEAQPSAPLADPFAWGDESDDEVAPSVEPLAVKRRGTIIGIDLGTTNTCAAYVVDGRPRIIPGRTGTNTIPSMVTFDPDGSWHVGHRAASRQVLHPLRTVYGSKRLVGRTYRPELAAQLQQHFSYPLGEAEGQRFGVRIDQRVISMDMIAARVLDEVRRSAEEHLKGPVDAAVITVPAYFSEVQREAVRRAAREANLAVQRIVNEPTAAAVAYGHRRGQGKRTRVAVWDLGGGTFDFSIVDVTDERLDVLTTGGDNFVGGSDFDDLVASYLLAEFQRAEGLSADPDPQQIARLREAAEAAKRALSAQGEHLVELPSFAQGRSLRVELTRDRFDQLTRPLVERTVAIASEVMADVALSPSDIDDVLLVGGSTRVLAVERAVAEFFQRRPSKGISPDEAVALGAALLADELNSGAPALHDILPMTIGHGAPGLRFVPLVPRNTRLPAQHEVTLDADLLGTVTLPMFQGESPDASRNEYLFSVLVEDRSLWDKGRVTLRLSLDEHCVLTVDARNARTGRPLALQLDRSRSVDEVLRELGHYEGPAQVAPWQMPPSRLGKTLGKLFSMFRR